MKQTAKERAARISTRRNNLYPHSSNAGRLYARHAAGGTGFRHPGGRLGTGKTYLAVACAVQLLERELAAGMIEIAPLAFMRSRTLVHAAIILDEAQNTTTMQMKMFLTRLGKNARMIVTGDLRQIDLPPGQKSDLPEALRILECIENIVTVHFPEQDVVHHPLVTAIVDAYDRDTRRQAAQKAE